MSRYIDAEKLICDIDGSECLDTERDYEEVARRIDECETADVEEVKHGEWVEDFMIGEGVYRCTNCDDKFVTLEGTPYDNRLFYCPFCGAKMDGKEKNDGET